MAHNLSLLPLFKSQVTNVVYFQNHAILSFAFYIRGLLSILYGHVRLFCNLFEMLGQLYCVVWLGSGFGLTIGLLFF